MWNHLRSWAYSLWLVAGVWLSAGIAKCDEVSIPERAVVPLQVLSPTCDGTTCSLQATSRGSAVCIDCQQGKVILLTARHCLPDRGGEVLQVYIRGIWVASRCWKYSKLNADLAIITAEAADCDEMACLGQKRPAIGEPVTLTGYTHGRTFQAITGKVTRSPEADPLYDWAELPQRRFGREVFGGSVVEGQSGGGVFDASGDLVGILTNRDGDSPWLGRYVALDEVRRCVISAGLLAGRSSESGRSADGRSGPRLAPTVPEPPKAAVPPEAPRIEPVTPPAPAVVPQVAPPEDKAGVDPETVPAAPVDRLSPVLPSVPGAVPPPEAPRIEPVAPLWGTPPPEKARTLINLPKILEGIGGKVAETQGKQPVTTPVTAQKAGAEPGDSSGFWASLVPLGLGIAGTVATGGAGWMMLVRPAMNTIHAGIAEIKAHRTNQVNSSPVASVAAGPSAQNVAQILQRESQPGGTLPAGAPFPRQLDEASQLLQLAKSEGRVPVLDALRGVFVDDEIEKLATSGDSVAAGLAVRLRQALDQRINEVVPPSTHV